MSFRISNTSSFTISATFSVQRIFILQFLDNIFLYSQKGYLLGALISLNLDDCCRFTNCCGLKHVKRGLPLSKNYDFWAQTVTINIMEISPIANVRKTGTLQRTYSTSFNNKKSLSQQDGCDNHTRREKRARAYNSNTMPQALPADATSSSAYINTSDLKGQNREKEYGAIINGKT